jgi:hypothetical protein
MPPIPGPLLQRHLALGEHVNFRTLTTQFRRSGSLSPLPIGIQSMVVWLTDIFMGPVSVCRRELLLSLAFIPRKLP